MFTFIVLALPLFNVPSCSSVTLYNDILDIALLRNTKSECVLLLSLFIASALPLLIFFHVALRHSTMPF